MRIGHDVVNVLFNQRGRSKDTFPGVYNFTSIEDDIFEAAHYRKSDLVQAGLDQRITLESNKYYTFKVGLIL